MNAADFELKLSLPAEARFANAIRDVAVHAARYAGSTESDADRYGAAVERVARSCLDRAAAGAQVSAIVRRGAGPVEFLIGCEERFDAASQEGSSTSLGARRVGVEWTREHGISMCRVAMDL